MKKCLFIMLAFIMITFFVSCVKEDEFDEESYGKEIQISTQNEEIKIPGEAPTED